MSSIAEKLVSDPKVHDAFIDYTCGCLRGVDVVMVEPIVEAVLRESKHAALVETLKELLRARDDVRATVQHFHGNRLEKQRDAEAANKARLLLRELGEAR